LRDGSDLKIRHPDRFPRPPPIGCPVACPVGERRGGGAVERKHASSQQDRKRRRDGAMKSLAAAAGWKQRNAIEHLGFADCRCISVAMG
jgi:hypothetical protein